MDSNWITSSAVHDYALHYSEPESDVLSALNEATHAEVRGAQMLSGALQGAVLSMLSAIVNPRNVLELGTYTGYSAICLAKGLQAGGSVHTIDIDDKLNDMREHYWRAAGLAEKIRLYIGPAIEVLERIEVPFDLVFLDADKSNYTNYFDILMERLPIGAVILADNVLFHGDVLKPVEEQSNAAKHIQAFNEHVKRSDRVETVMLPIRDGISVIRKIK